MMTNNNIDETLRSLEGIYRATAPAGLHERIMTALPAAGGKVIQLSPRTIWLAAAGIALLICINAALLQERKVSRNERSSDSPLYDEYFNSQLTD